MKISSEQQILMIPYLLLMMLIIHAMVKKKKWFSSAVLALGFSIGPVLFHLLKNDLLAHGNFRVGLSLGMSVSLVATIPLLVFGWYLGHRFQSRFVYLLALLGVILNLGVVKSYQYVINGNAAVLNKKIDFDCQKNPYHCAVRDNNLGIISELKLKGFDIESRDLLSRSALWYGIDNFEAVKTLLDNGANPDSFNIYGETPLAYSMVISLSPNLKIAQLLIDKGAEINRMFSFRKKISILNFAIVNKNYDAINFALANGADPYIVDGYKKSPCERLKKMNLEDVPKRDFYCQK